MREQRVEARADLALAAGGDLVVVQLDVDADLHEVARHLRAQVLVVVHRRHREVALLGAGLVAEVRALVLAGVPDALDRVDQVHGQLRLVVEAHVVEDEELGLGAEVGRCRRCRSTHVLLGLRRDVPRVTAVALAGDRVGDEAVDDQRLVLHERVDVGGVGIRDAGSCPTPGSAGTRGSTSRRSRGRRRTCPRQHVAGIVTCCMIPGRSQNRRSTNSHPSLCDQRQHLGWRALLHGSPPELTHRSIWCRPQRLRLADFPAVARL